VGPSDPLIRDSISPCIESMLRQSRINNSPNEHGFAFLNNPENKLCGKSEYNQVLRFNYRKSRRHVNLKANKQDVHLSTSLCTWFDLVTY